MDGERSACFFAKHVVICEGASEKILFDHLLDNEWSDLRNNHIYFLNAMGKFNLHRYMNLFKELGIYHSVIFDRDNNQGIHKLVNDFLGSNMNEYTKGINHFDSDLENFLEITLPCRRDLKPLNIVKIYAEGLIQSQKITELKQIVTREIGDGRK
jgi:predicted ATP-dependent endonuclease of OLD family